jgi:hypothetical protein
MDAAPNPETVTLIYPIVKSSDRAVLPISGAFGGVNGNANLILHFFLDYPEMPESTTVVAPKGGGIVIKETLNQTHKDHVTREVVATLAIPIQMALPLANLIQDQVKKFMEGQSSPITKQ